MMFPDGSGGSVDGKTDLKSAAGLDSSETVFCKFNVSLRPFEVW